MGKMCLFLAVIVMSAIAIHGKDLLEEEKEIETIVEDVLMRVLEDQLQEQDEDQVVCGRRPAVRFKRQTNLWINIPNPNTPEYYGTEPLRRGEAPWHVNIFAANGQVCGGAVISEFWVVTAASCAIPSVGRDKSWLTVGDVLRGVPEDGEQRFDTAAMIPHPRYRPETNEDYNLALVKVAPTSDGRGIRFNTYVQPICLPNESVDVLPDSAELIISGLPNGFTGNAFKVNMRALNHQRCIRDFGVSFAVSDNMLCASRDDLSLWRTCDGLQGLPAARIKDGIAILAGIRSVNKVCNPIVLANLFRLANPWIPEVIKRGSDNDNEYEMPFRPV